MSPPALWLWLGLFLYVAKAYFRLFYLSFFRRSATLPPYRRSPLFCLAFFTLYTLRTGINALCFALDTVIFPRLGETRIERPLFLIGLPRSGKTALHRILARDEERFFSFLTWEIIFPSLVQKKILAVLGRADRRLGGPLSGLNRRWEKRRFEKLGRVHRLSLFLPEEDEHLMNHILSGILMSFIFPYGNFERSARFDTVFSDGDQRVVMGFYVQCVLRQTRFRGVGKSLLSQSPVFSGWVRNLLEHFPGGRVVFMVRNPLDVVPSFISLYHHICTLMFGKEPLADADEKSLDMVKFFYNYPLEVLSSFPEEQWVVVRYEDLMREPKATVVGIYDRFGLVMTPEYESILDREAEEMRRFRSPHRYAPEECSISRDRILSELRSVFERFGFDTREAGTIAEPG